MKEETYNQMVLLGLSKGVENLEFAKLMADDPVGLYQMLKEKLLHGSYKEQLESVKLMSALTKLSHERLDQMARKLNTTPELVLEVFLSMEFPKDSFFDQSQKAFFDYVKNHPKPKAELKIERKTKKRRSL